jgi:hypothetical protein
LLALGLANNPETRGKAFLLFSTGLFVFTIAYETIAWLEERRVQKQQIALPESLSLSDIVHWKNDQTNDETAKVAS